jgi:hypothetical protein
VLWLTGVDYFSTLGCQPGIALLAAGALSISATAILVAVTLLATVPGYAQVAKRSYVGQGSIALLENLFSGWKGKLFVLVLLAFAATDFVITMTLSAADAARHTIADPYFGDTPVALTRTLVRFGHRVSRVQPSDRPRAGRCHSLSRVNVVVLLRGVWELVRHP